MSLRKLKGNPFVNYENSKTNYCSLVADAVNGLHDQETSLATIMKLRLDYSQYLDYKQRQIDTQVSTTSQMKYYGLDLDDNATMSTTSKI